MNIIIAGAGKVGFNLAKALSIGHNVTIIDKNAEALSRIQESLDIMPHRGDVEDAKTYESFIHTQIDFFIAVTNVDNVNLIATIVADTVLDINKKFVRIQKEFFDVEKVKSKLGIDKLIFPLQLASKAISSLLSYPKANNVKFFKYTQHKLISVMVSSNYVPTTFEHAGVTIVAIERNKRFFIPQTQDVEVAPNDLVYFFGLEEDIFPLCKLFAPEIEKSLQRCVVFGAEELGIGIAKELLRVGRDVKLVEKDLERCQRADEALQGKAMIINSKYSAHDVFEEEALESADIFIAATSNDEYNVVKCLEAHESGIKKVVAINNEMEYYNLMHSLGIIVVRGPKISAYNKIMEEISSTGVVIQKFFCGAKGIILMRKVFHNSHLVGKKIKPFHLQNTLLLYIREGKMFPFHEKMTLEKDDLLIVFAPTNISAKLKQWIYGL